jgi:hypothetical protein
MTVQEFDTALDEGYQDMLAGSTIPIKQAFDEIRKKNGQ